MTYHFYPKECNLKSNVTNLYDKNEYVIHIRHLKQALNHVLILKKVHGVTKINQKDWSKLYFLYCYE